MQSAGDWVQRSYRRGLVHKMDALIAARTALLDGDDDARGTIRRLAHLLRGSGGTYGHPDLSRAAARVEGADVRRLIVALDDLLGELRRVVAPPDARHSSVLVVTDDDEAGPTLVLTAQPYAHRVDRVTTLQEARSALAARRPNVLLLDLLLPDGDGRTLLMEVAGDATLAGMAVVVLAARINPHVRSECLALGAHEVHCKPLDPVLWATAVAALCGYEGRTSLQIDGDPVTGLTERGMMLECLRQARQQYDVDFVPWSLLMLSIDDYDELAARHGRGPLDDTLRACADAIRSVCSAPEYVACRWSGGLFGIALPRTGETEATAYGTQIIEAIGSRMVTGDAGTDSIQISVGGVEAGASEARQALTVARRMLALAAAAGGGQVVVSSTVEAARGRSVLVVDDDLDSCRMVTAQLEHERFRVAVRHTGPDALALLKERRFDLVVLDVDMPGMTGLEVLRALRSSVRHRDMLVMMLTSYGEERHVVEGFDAGADEYMVKPFAPQLLRARVRNLLTRRA